jgi:hypothetical protein
VAQASSAACAPRGPFIADFQQRQTAITAVLFRADLVAPALPFSPVIYGGERRGPVVRFSYHVRRVFKGGDSELEPGDTVLRTERVHTGTNIREDLGTVYGVFPSRTVFGWQLPSMYYFECSPGLWVEPANLYEAALMDRYASGRNAASHGCSYAGDTCWSIKRRSGRIVLRVASFLPGDDYRLCVRAPDDSKRCRRFTLKPDRGDLRSSRVGWAERFPDRGRGEYEVTWELPGLRPLDDPSYRYRLYRSHQPKLVFRR